MEHGSAEAVASRGVGGRQLGHRRMGLEDLVRKTRLRAVRVPPRLPGSDHDESSGDRHGVAEAISPRRRRPSAWPPCRTWRRRRSCGRRRPHAAMRRYNPTQSIGIDHNGPRRLRHGVAEPVARRGGAAEASQLLVGDGQPPARCGSIVAGAKRRAEWQSRWRRAVWILAHASSHNATASHHHQMRCCFPRAAHGSSLDL